MGKKKHTRTKETRHLEKWETIVAKAFAGPGATLTLSTLYSEIDGTERTKINPHWKAKIRQVLQKSPLFERVDRGLWKLKPTTSTASVRAKR